VRPVHYRPEARAEFLHEVQYYAAISPRLAEQFDRAVRSAELSAAPTQDAWPKYMHKTRRVVERRFKLSLVYLYAGSEIYVAAVASSNRRPGYWKGKARLGGA
jgi:toxin ParE1/3/4